MTQDQPDKDFRKMKAEEQWQEVLGGMMMKALGTLNELLDDQDPAIRIKAAIHIIDKKIATPQRQEIKVDKTVNLGQFAQMWQEKIEAAKTEAVKKANESVVDATFEEIAREEAEGETGKQIL